LALATVSNKSVAEKEWQDLWANDAYEHEFYYVSQLFEPNWQSRTMA
jgi:hypothetical protein